MRLHRGCGTRGRGSGLARVVVGARERGNAAAFAAGYMGPGPRVGCPGSRVPPLVSGGCGLSAPVYRVPNHKWRLSALGFGCVRVSAGKAGNQPHKSQNRRPKAGRASNWPPLGFGGFMLGAPGLSGVEYA